MALIKCIECGRQFSSFADACPGCGCPTHTIQSAQKSGLPAADQGAPVEPTAPVKETAVAPAPITESTFAVKDTVPSQAAPVQVAPIVTPLVAPVVSNNENPATATPTVAQINQTVSEVLAQTNQNSAPEFCALICPACGSNDVNMVTTDYGVCTHCGSKVLLNPVKKSSAEIHIHAAGMQSGEYYGIKQTLSPTDFYRKVLLQMVRSENTPPDLFDGQFDTAVLSSKHIAEYTGNIFGSYNVEIGYDMERRYQEWNGQKYVTKTERYIDWKPFSGNYAGTQRAYVSLDELDPLDEGIETAFALFHTDDEIKKEVGGTEDIVLPTGKHEARALEKCKYSAERDVIASLPGNHYKNLYFNANGQITNTTCYTVPAYRLPFHYKQELFAKSAFAVNSDNLVTYGYIPDISDDIKADVDKTTRPVGISSIILLSVSVVLSLLLGALHEHILKAVGLGLCIPLFVGALGVTIGYWIYRKRYRQAVVDANKHAKLRGVSKVLQEKTLAPITAEEEDDIMGRKRK